MKRLKFCSLIFILLFVIVFGCYFIYNYFDGDKNNKNNNIKQEEKVDKPEVNKLSLVMVGDALIHSAVYGDAKENGVYDFKSMLENVKEYISSFDLAFYNQESILGGTELGLSTYPSFNSPYEVGDAFRDMGFNLVSLANNHTLDRGEKAIINSRNYWNQYDNIIVSGSSTSYEERDNIKILEKNSISYALLSYTDLTNGLKTPSGKDYLVDRYSEERVREDIAKIRDKVDLLLVSMHFGVEYKHTPTSRQKEIANLLSELGVDIVIGHHPHVVQPIEFIGDTMVIYSLGNFISAQRGISRLTGLMANIDVVKTTFQGESKLELDNPNVELVYTDSVISGKSRYNFKLYNYNDLTEDILPSYKTYQKRYLDIVMSESFKMKKGDIDGDIK